MSVVKSFKCIGSVSQKRGGFEENMVHRINYESMKWREASGVLCDKMVPIMGKR